MLDLTNTISCLLVCLSGKYVCDNDASADGGGNRYAAPPSPFPVPVPATAALSTTTEAEEV